MICAHCKAIHHICPECGGVGHWFKTKPGYLRYECCNGHRWNEKDGVVIELKRGRPREIFAEDTHVRTLPVHAPLFALVNGKAVTSGHLRGSDKL